MAEERSNPTTATPLVMPAPSRATLTPNPMDRSWARKTFAEIINPCRESPWYPLDRAPEGLGDPLYNAGPALYMAILPAPDSKWGIRIDYPMLGVYKANDKLFLKVSEMNQETNAYWYGPFDPPHPQ